MNKHFSDIHFHDSYQTEWKYVDISEILEPTETKGGLYLGNSVISQDLVYLKENKIPIILDVCGQKFVYPEDIIEAYKCIEAEDSPYFDLAQYFDECLEFIHEHRLKGRNVFVHCKAGVSRSATIVICYLMKILEMDFENAYKFVKMKRTCIEPNEGFLEQIEKFGKKLKEKIVVHQPIQN